MQTHQVHGLVHKESRPGHIAAVFQQREQEEHYHNVRQEGNHSSHALDHSVHEHARKPSLRQRGVEEDTQGVHPLLYPALRPSTQGEGELKYPEQYEHHNGETQPAAGKDAVQLLGEAVVGTVLSVDEGFLEGTGNETAAGLCNQHLRGLPELEFQPVVTLARDGKHLVRIRQTVYVRKYIVLVLEQAQGQIAL